MLADSTRCDPRFLPLLRPIGVDPLDADPCTAYGVWPDLTLAYFNPAWQRFAEANGGAAVLSRFGLATPVLRGVTGPLHHIYEGAYRRVLAGGEPWEQRYECSSATVFRAFQMRVAPLGRGGAAGLLVTNALLVEHPQPADGSVAPLAEYLDRSGIVHQCSHCRRTRREAGDESGRWDWVPALVEQAPRRVSHGLCYLCFGHYDGGPAPAPVPVG